MQTLLASVAQNKLQNNIKCKITTKQQKMMKTVMYFAQVITIVIVGTCILLVATSAMCFASGNTGKGSNAVNNPAKVNVAAPTDTDSVALSICEELLEKSKELGFLDERGIQRFEELKGMHSVSAYMELIEECENEESYYDTITGEDVWERYVYDVLDPRGLAD